MKKNKRSFFLKIINLMLILGLVFAPISLPTMRSDSPSSVVHNQKQPNAKQIYFEEYAKASKTKVSLESVTKSKKLASPIASLDGLAIQTLDTIDSVLKSIVDATDQLSDTPIKKKAKDIETIPQIADIGPAQSYNFGDGGGETSPITFGFLGGISVSFNAEENKLTLNDAKSEVKEVTLDEKNQPIETVDVRGDKTTAEYNENGDPIKIEDPNGQITYYAYNDSGNLIAITTEKPRDLSKLSFLGRVARKLFGFVYADETMTQNLSLSYSGDNIVAVSDDNGSVQYNYDSTGNLTGEQNQDNARVEYEYDELGNVTGKKVVEPVQPAAIGFFGKLFAKIFGWVLADQYITTQSAKFAYDENNNPSGLEISIPTDQVILPALTPDPVMVPPEVVAEPQVDVPQVDTTVITPTPDSTPTVTPASEPNSNPISTFFGKLRQAFSRTIAWSFAQVTSTDPAPETRVKKIISLLNTHDALGNIKTTTNQKGEVTTYFYDNRTDTPIGRKITDKDGNAILNVNYGFDNSNSRWTTRTDSLGNQESYVYDSLGQLIKNSNTSFEYNDNGNRTKQTNGQGVTAYEYDGNRLTKVTKPSGATVTFDYDQLGNVTTRTDSESGVTAYGYNMDNYLDTISLSAGKTIRYYLDPLKRRVSKTVTDGSFSKNYFYAYEAGNLTSVKDDFGVIIRQYVYDAKNKLIAIVKDGATYSVIRDSHGSVVALTDEDSKIVEQFSYDAWGHLLNNQAPSALTDFYYAGYFYEPDAGLYILGPRGYDPNLGRFLSKDPLPGDLNDKLSQNEYIYALNDPVNKVDPTGHRAASSNASGSLKAVADAAQKTADEMGRLAEEAQKQVDETAANLEQLQAAAETANTDFGPDQILDSTLAPTTDPVPAVSGPVSFFKRTANRLMAWIGKTITRTYAEETKPDTQADETIVTSANTNLVADLLTQVSSETERHTAAINALASAREAQKLAQEMADRNHAEAQRKISEAARKAAEQEAIDKAVSDKQIADQQTADLKTTDIPVVTPQTSVNDVQPVDIKPIEVAPAPALTPAPVVSDVPAITPIPPEKTSFLQKAMKTAIARLPLAFTQAAPAKKSAPAPAKKSAPAPRPAPAPVKVTAPAPKITPKPAPAVVKPVSVAAPKPAPTPIKPAPAPVNVVVAKANQATNKTTVVNNLVTTSKVNNAVTQVVSNLQKSATPAIPSAKATGVVPPTAKPTPKPVVVKSAPAPALSKTTQIIAKLTGANIAQASTIKTSPATPQTSKDVKALNKATSTTPLPSIAKPTPPSLGTIAKDVVKEVAKGLGTVVNTIDKTTAILLSVVKGGSMFVAGMTYQVVDSSLFNSLSVTTKLFGGDVNEIPSLPYQIGRQTGNNVVIGLSLLAVAAGTGTAAGGTAAVVTGTGICIASLAGGGTALVPCAIAIPTAAVIAKTGALTATYGGVTYLLSKRNQDDIKKAVDKAGAEVAVNRAKGVKSGAQAERSVILAERTRLLNSTQNTKLKGVIDELYRAKDDVFGGTAGAVRYERATGKLLSPTGHTQKAQGRAKELSTFIKRADISTSDRQLATELRNDLLNALAGK